MFLHALFHYVVSFLWHQFCSCGFPVTRATFGWSQCSQQAPSLLKLAALMKSMAFLLSSAPYPLPQLGLLNLQWKSCLTIYHISVYCWSGEFSVVYEWSQGIKSSMQKCPPGCLRFPIWRAVLGAQRDGTALSTLGESSAHPQHLPASVFVPTASLCVCWLGKRRFIQVRLLT